MFSNTAPILFMFLFNSDVSSIFQITYLNELEMLHRKEKCIKVKELNIDMQECYFKHNIYDNSKYLIIEGKTESIIMEKKINNKFVRDKFFKKLKEEIRTKIYKKEEKNKIIDYYYMIESRNEYNFVKENFVKISENNNNNTVSLKFYRKK
jgi:hypothetical protein